MGGLTIPTDFWLDRRLGKRAGTRGISCGQRKAPPAYSLVFYSLVSAYYWPTAGASEPAHGILPDGSGNWFVRAGRIGLRSGLEEKGYLDGDSSDLRGTDLDSGDVIRGYSANDGLPFRIRFV